MPDIKGMSSRTKKLILTIATSLVVFSIAAVVAGTAMTSRPQTCSLCHEMKDSVKAWQASSHEKITCIECHHKEPGYLGFVVGIPNKISEATKHVSGNYQIPIKASHSTKSEVCQKCHVSWRNVSPGGDLLIPHNLHFEKRKIDCVVCHSSVVHGENLDNEIMRRPSMQLCLSCHDTGRESAPILACKECHTEKGVPSSHNEKDWFEMHGQLYKDPTHPDSLCDDCHGWTPTFCSDCHKSKLPTTHYGGTQWRTFHSIRAKVRKSGCLVCHDAKSFCYKCHDPFEDVEKGK